MNSKVLIHTCIAMLLFLSSCNINDEYNIQGNIAEAEDGMLVYLKIHGQDNPLDSAYIESEGFVFQGKLDHPQLVNIVIMKHATPADPRIRTWQPIIPLFLENSDIAVSASLEDIPDEQQLGMRRYTYDNIIISGSESHHIYADYFWNKKECDNRRSDIFMNEYIRYLNPGQGVEKGPISEGIDIVGRIDLAANDTKQYVLDFIESNADNMVGLHVAKENLGLFAADEIEKLLLVLSPKLLKTSQGDELIVAANEIKQTAIGSEFADIDLFDTYGNAAKLSDYLGKGHYVLLNFWASWCGPCISDLPHKMEAYELYKSEGFDIVSISMDTDKAKWLEKIEEYQIPWVQLSDLTAFEGEISRIYNFRGIPTNLLINPEGIIVSRNMRGSWMDKWLIELYGDKF
jgi:thiol-disulfide isomerase/thioredoxin